LRRNCNAIRGMCMNDEAQIVSCPMYRRMDCEACCIDSESTGIGGRTLIDHASFVVDLYQIRRTHLMEQKTVPVNEKGRGLTGLSWEACGYMRIDHVRHTEMGDESVQRRKLPPNRPFCFGSGRDPTDGCCCFYESHGSIFSEEMNPPVFTYTPEVVNFVLVIQGISATNDQIHRLQA